MNRLLQTAFVNSLSVSTPVLVYSLQSFQNGGFISGPGHITAILENGLMAVSVVRKINGEDLIDDKYVVHPCQLRPRSYSRPTEPTTVLERIYDRFTRRTFAEGERVRGYGQLWGNPNFTFVEGRVFANQIGASVFITTGHTLSEQPATGLHSGKHYELYAEQIVRL